MTPQQLKNSILQLAVQGRLAEQRPEEGTGEELFAKIAEEKKKLIAGGKLKKEKPLPEITDEEIPFEIPDSWKWVRLGEIVINNPKNEAEDDILASFIPMPLVKGGYSSEHTYELKPWGAIKKGFTHFAAGDIGIAKITPCFQNRKSVIFSNLENGIGAGTTELSVIRVVNETLIRKYLLYFLKTDYFISNGIKSFTGTAGQQRIHKDYIVNTVFPLPPLAEQKRIVEKIETLMPLCERYEQAWKKSEELGKNFPADMQKSILQLAVQGRLAEQRPEEGTGEELFAKIAEEKKKLIAGGKLKKEKPLPKITDEEKPFEIPDSWKWVRLGEIVSKEIKRGKSPIYTVKSNVLVFAQKCNTKAGYIDLGLSKCLDESTLGKYPSEEFMVNKDIVINSTGHGTLGRVGIYHDTDNPQDTPLVPDSHVTVIRTVAHLINEYIFYVLKSYQPFLEKLGSGSTNQTELSAGKIKKLLFPLPPLAEQKRIVEKIETLMPLCDSLKDK